MNELIEYNMSDDLQKDLYGIIENAQQTAIVSVNSVLVIRNWLIGMRISREKMSGTRSERYGEGIISELADELTQKYGKGFDKRSLYRYVQFYQSYPEIVGIMTSQSDDLENFGIVGTTTPQSGEHAVGQMDMYVRMYDELRKQPEDNPTVGIVLCSETDEDIARYSVLQGNEQLFASKYRLCLPTEEQLRAEIDAQKEIFYMQHPELDKKEKSSNKILNI